MGSFRGDFDAVRSEFMAACRDRFTAAEMVGNVLLDLPPMFAVFRIDHPGGAETEIVVNVGHECIGRLSADGRSWIESLPRDDCGCGRFRKLVSDPVCTTCAG